MFLLRRLYFFFSSPCLTTHGVGGHDMQAAKRKIPHVNYRTVNDPAMPCTKHDGQVVDRRVRRRRRGRKGFIPVSIARGIHSLPHSSGFCHHPRLSAAALGTLSKAMSTEMAPGGKQNEKKNLRYLFGMGERGVEGVEGVEGAACTALLFGRVEALLWLAGGGEVAKHCCAKNRSSFSVS